MNVLDQLLEARKIAGLAPLSIEQQTELAEKKLTGQEKEDFLARMSGKKTKKDKEVDDGEPGPTKGARKAMDAATIKGSVSGEKGPKKRKVSENLNDVLTGAGLKALSEADAAKIDAKYPDPDVEAVI